MNKKAHDVLNSFYTIVYVIVNKPSIVLPGLFMIVVTALVVLTTVLQHTVEKTPS